VQLQFRFASAFVMAIGMFITEGLLVSALKMTYDAHNFGSGGQ
jgi:hypothetical protein